MLYGVGGNPFSLASVPGLVLGLDPRYGVYTDGGTALASASSQYYSIANNSDQGFSGTDWTFCCWVYLNSTTGNRGLLVRDDSVAQREIILSVNSSNPAAYLFHDGQYTSTDSLSTNTWTFLCFRCDSASRLLGISVNNGTEYTATYAASAIASATCDTNFGRRNSFSDYQIDGRMASIGKWNRRLSSSDIAAIYNSGSGLTYSQLTTAQKTDLKYWYGFRTSPTLVNDSHGSNTLTSNNGPTYAAGVALEAVQADGDPVAEWWDYRKLTAGDAFYKVSQSTGSARPLWKTNVQNGKPVIRFDGTNDFLRYTGTTWTQPNNLFVVTKQTGASASLVTDSVTAVQSAIVFRNFGSAASVYAGSFIDGATDISNTWKILGAIYNGASSGLYINGASDASGDAGTNSQVGLTIGARYTDTLPAAGDYGPVALYNANVSASNRAALFAYLNSLYGVY